MDPVFQVLLHLNPTTFHFLLKVFLIKPPWQPGGLEGSLCATQASQVTPRLEARSQEAGCPHSVHFAGPRAASVTEKGRQFRQQMPRLQSGGGCFLTCPVASHSPGAGPGNIVLKLISVLHDPVVDLKAFSKSLFCLNWSK